MTAALLEKPRNEVTTQLWRPKPELWQPGLDVDEIERYLAEESIGHNLRTNAGANWQAGQMSGAATDARAVWIALTADTTQTINASQTTLTGEETTNGLARSTSAGTFSHAGGGATSYTVARTFTYTGGSAITIVRAGLFTASAAGTMVFFAAFGVSANMTNGDQLVVTWTINI